MVKGEEIAKVDWERGDATVIDEIKLEQFRDSIDQGRSESLVVAGIEKEGSSFVGSREGGGRN